ncbi:hypothetical protein L226DRAFT_575337 [Lentinus tigrinus ALCF2SS1-7]|uniref:Uncharacterized protein n=1 Tax=Lentinus tigrinus ALCF2SS1-6 TaxID=1328759 RepID=A0A5C2S5D8_9APHY|nr:hypothetical protein L227DRAFT_612628 [Lentinus tigrinus ALCF2SS1-6]RPD69870.1 hypothetical protein L226DRAFT_575337 [Lentinus tigrinus ALCF2SS1-7]
MQFTAKFNALAVAVVAAMVSQVAASPAPVASVVSTDEFLKWLDTTDADITYIGKPINGSVPRAAQDVMVTYCNKRTQNVCGGTCTVYNGPAACLAAGGTACLSATANVGFCDRGGCGGSCNQLSTCGTHLDNGFCFTPGTASIIVPPS